MMMNKIEEWKNQLEQAEEYGLFFDKETVKEMLETIECYEKALKKIVDHPYTSEGATIVARTVLEKVNA